MSFYRSSGFTWQPSFAYLHDSKSEPGATNHRAPRGLAYLHSERGVHAMVEVKVGGAVVGPARDPQVAVPDATIQLVLYGVLLQCMDPAQVKALESDPPPPNKNKPLSSTVIHHLGDSPLVDIGADQGLHVFVQLLQHVGLREVNGGSVVHIQAVGYCIVAPYVSKRE